MAAKTNKFKSGQTNNLKASLQGFTSKDKSETKAINVTPNSESMDVKDIPISKLIEADNSWNFFKPLNVDKMEELILSILENGLIHAIVISDNNDGTYTILSGHNRVSAYKYIFERTSEEKYLNISASIKKGLSEDEQREIVIDSNWVQRVLSPSEKVKSIHDKYILLGRKKREKNGKEHIRNYDILADEYGFSGKQIQRYIRLNNLSKGFLNLLDEDKISLRAGVIISNFDSETQAYILKLLKSQKGLPIENKRLEKLKKNMTRADIETTLLKDEDKFTKVAFTVPENLEQDFIKMAETWLKLQVSEK